MIIENFNLKLRRIRESDIETLRQWRNSDFVKGFMEFQGHITPEMQEGWFMSINNVNNLYLFIEYRNEKVGVINVKEINYKDSEAETGIYMANEGLIDSIVPVLACGIIAEVLLYFFGFKSLGVHVLKSNRRSIHLVKALGFQLKDNQENIENQAYYVDLDNARNITNRLEKSLRALCGEDSRCRLIFEPEDFVNGQALEFIERLDPLIPIHRTFGQGGICFSGITPLTDSKVEAKVNS